MQGIEKVTDLNKVEARASLGGVMRLYTADGATFRSIVNWLEIEHTLISQIKEELGKIGHNVFDAHTPQRRSEPGTPRKSPVNMFFLNIAAAANNKAILAVKTLCHTRVIFKTEDTIMMPLRILVWNADGIATKLHEECSVWRHEIYVLLLSETHCKESQAPKIFGLRPILLTPRVPATPKEVQLSLFDLEQAEVFAGHLAERFQPFNLASLQEIQDTDDQLTQALQMDLPINPFDPSEIAEVNASLNTNRAPGHAAICNATLKALPRHAVCFIALVFNATVRLQYFPPQWNLGLITMTHKPGKPESEPSSFRPITYDNKEYCNTLYLDIRVAFDRVWHAGMLIRSYLEGRRFAVRFHKPLSTEYDVAAGVPPCYTRLCNRICGLGKAMEYCHQQQQISQWRTPSAVLLDGDPVPQANDAKYLGVILDRRLTFAKHVTAITIRLRAAVKRHYWLLCSRSKLSLTNKVTIYNQIIAPIWIYGCQILGLACGLLETPYCTET
ncbi:hypothetical protein AWZ03_013895 [Drosophila navojoa]|uniref:Pre-C2HC domain-containing protein n=1 Tax=Drosophila navojoa TaxID=7232 RepID=A0A484ATJ5_DRONA|nr:hypothetical protein AWZ03_013895 [Drosophila navojoa]